MKNIWDLSLFLEEDVSDKKWTVFSEFVVLAVDWAITVTNNEFVRLFLIKVLEKLPPGQFLPAGEFPPIKFPNTNLNRNPNPFDRGEFTGGKLTRAEFSGQHKLN